MNKIIPYCLACVIAYLLGSVSTGLIVARLRHGPDLRQVGSKNTGASNVLRTMGKKAGLITFFGDFAKAALSCLIGRLITGEPLYGAMAAGLCCVLGHNWPLFFQFNGGKGVASSCGVMLVCFPVPALISYAAAILIIAVTKYISLGSISMLTLYAVITSVFISGGRLPVILWAVFLALLCVFRHHENIGRLLNGKERKLGEKV